MHYQCKALMIRVLTPSGEASPTATERQDAAPVRGAAVEPGWPAERVVTRQAPIVERLAYRRSQAAEALVSAALPSYGA
jgi:hypothetical protein